jgi:hypothetical protein
MITPVRAIRRLSKSQALDQFRQNPELASNISAAARVWGVARATARGWLADAAAIAEPPAPSVTAMEAPPSPADAFKAVLCHLADLVETTTLQEILDSADSIELLGLQQDCELVSAYVGAIETMAGAAIKRAGR